jgi:cation transport regulator ChaB
MKSKGKEKKGGDASLGEKMSKQNKSSDQVSFEEANNILHDLGGAGTFIKKVSKPKKNIAPTKTLKKRKPSSAEEKMHQVRALLPLNERRLIKELLIAEMIQYKDGLHLDPSSVWIEKAIKIGVNQCITIVKKVMEWDK